MNTTTTDTLYRMRGMCADEQIRRLHAENARIRNMIARGGLSRTRRSDIRVWQRTIRRASIHL